ncbi:MAG: hypothetical protein AAGJ35_09230 [Myxococcota bacterium]
MRLQILAFQGVVVFLYIVVFAEASLAKVVECKTPDWFREQFAKTWLARLAPVALLWWTIVLLELTLAVWFGLAAASFFGVLGGQPQWWIGWGTLGAAAFFGVLCFGQRVSFDFMGAANSFFYGVLSLLLWAIVFNAPQY